MAAEEAADLAEAVEAAAEAEEAAVEAEVVTAVEAAVAEEATEAEDHIKLLVLTLVFKQRITHLQVRPSSPNHF